MMDALEEERVATEALRFFEQQQNQQTMQGSELDGASKNKERWYVSSSFDLIAGEQRVFVGSMYYSFEYCLSLILILYMYNDMQL